MGRYLSAGIPAQIYIEGKEGWTRTKLKKIRNEIQKYVNLDLYNETIYSDGARLILKENIFDDNIHRTLQEFEKFTHFSNDFLENFGYYETCTDIKKMQKEYPCKLMYDVDDGSSYKRSGVQCNDKFYTLDGIFPSHDNWLVVDSELANSSTGLQCTVTIEYLRIWMDWYKYSGEAEYNIIRMLKRLKLSAFKDGNDLTKTILYCVE